MRKPGWKLLPLFFVLIGLTGTQVAPGQPDRILQSGQRLYDEGKYRLAADTLAVAIALYDELGKTHDRIRAMNLQAESLSNLGQCDEAEKILNTSLSLLEKEGNTNKLLLADTWYYLARRTGGCARKFDEAIRMMRRSTDLKMQIYSEGDPALAFNYNFLGYIYNSKGKYDSAHLYLDKAMAIRKKLLVPDDIELSHTLFNLAASYEGKSDLIAALELNEQALRIRSKKLGRENATISNSINSLGRIYRKLGNNQRALDYYKESLEIRKATLGESHPNVAASYYEIGNLYGNVGNYHASLEYIAQGNRILESNTQVFNDVLPSYVAYEGKMSALTGKPDQARQLATKAVQMAEEKLAPTQPYRAIVYNVAAECYGELKDFEKQSGYFSKAIKIYRATYGEGSEREGDILLKAAATAADLNRNSEALQLHQDALAIFLTKLGEENPKVASAHLAIGDVYASIGDVALASKAYDNALISASLSSGDQTTGNKPMALKIFTSRARLLAKSASIDDWKQSLHAFQKALDLADDMTQEYHTDDSRKQLEKEKRELVSAAIDVTWKLYDEQKDNLLISEAFSLSERSKASILLENNRDQHAKLLGGVPDSIINNERDRKIELAYLNRNLFEAEQKNDTATVNALTRRIFESNRQLEQLKARLEQMYPSYFRLKYKNERPGLTAVMKRLPAASILVSYFVGDENVYCFTVSNSVATMQRTKADDAFFSMLRSYRTSLSEFNLIVEQPKKADSLYRTTAAALYEKLMLPNTGGDHRQLIIIPDGVLSHVNFGTLLFETPNESDFASLPYVGQRYPITYTYSADLLLQSKPHKNTDFAGFAPSYDGLLSTIDTTRHPMTALAMRDGNLPLPGAVDEVQIVSRLMNGRSWVNDEATETNFKKQSGNYGILHLAMHSLLNDENPQYSELLFNGSGDKENDGYLTIAEIYNLKLNAQLVVLSSCSSGFGQIQHGEGPISLSRAFSYAGCPSVVMSLWKVPDLVTKAIMKNFYENLNDGLSKDQALRDAQARFIKENKDPIYSHPYYWAGFVVVGDSSPLEKRSYTLHYLLGAFAVSVGVAFFLRRKTQPASG